MSVSIPAHRVDPTGTETLRRTYARKLRAAFADINTLVREGVQEQDVFGLSIDVLQDDDLPPMLRFDRDQKKVQRFQRWLDGRLEDGPLEVISREDNRFIRSAYQRGLEDADNALNDVGITTGDIDVEDVFNAGVHQRAVRELYTADYSDLEDITQEVSEQVGEELAEGFAQGENPRKISRRITDRVDKVGKTRATTLARTRTIDAYSESTLNRYEQFEVRNVNLRAEWLTARDPKVCPICQSLAGQTWTIQEARNTTVELTESDVAEFAGADINPANFTGEFPVRPPSHPRCRCRLIPELA